MIFSSLLRYLITFLSFPYNLKREKLSDKQKKLIEDLKIDLYIFDTDLI